MNSNSYPIFYVTGSGTTNAVTTLRGLPQFSSMSSMASDPVSGTLYGYADDAIFRVSVASQIVSTLAGRAPGSMAVTTLTIDGVGTNAKFGSNAFIALSSDANIIYVSDPSNCRIRQVVIATQAVTSLAGDNCAVGTRANGIGENARFTSDISSIATDSNNNVYVADGYLIRKLVVSTRTVTTLGGYDISLMTGNYNLGWPMAAPKGLYFDLGGNGKLHVIYERGFLMVDVDTVSLDSTFSSISSASFGALAMDSKGNLFFTSQTACQIWQFNKITQSPSSSATLLAGSGSPAQCASVDGVGSDIRLSFSTTGLKAPTLAADSTSGILYIYEPDATISISSQLLRIRMLHASAPCSAGSYCPAGSSSLNQGGQCPAGYYCPQGSDRIACPAGKFCVAGTPSAAQAPSCSVGTYCPAGSSTDTNNRCAAGFYCPTPATQPICPQGFFCAAGVTVASPCSAGSLCLNGSSTLNQGGTCPVGYFCAAGAARAACTAGKYCPAGSSSQNQGGDCAAGYYCPSGRERVACVGSYCAGGNPNDLMMCTPGYACPGGGVVRQICPIGRYAAGGNVTACTICPRGLVAANIGAFFMDSEATIPVGIVWQLRT
jgi:hypothetical protein